MPFLLTLLVFIGLAVAVALVGMKLYVRPKEAMERVVGGIEQADQMPAHPSLALHDLIKKLGNFIPQSPKDVTVMQRRLIRAGIRNESALKILYGAKAALGVLLPLLTAAVVSGSSSDSGNKFAAILAAAAVGFFGPNEYVRRLAGKRQKAIAHGLANALDLMVVCIEAGLSLDASFIRVGQEVRESHRRIAEEFGRVSEELRAGRARAEALRDMADRTDVVGIRSFVSLVIQTETLGASITQALRTYSVEMRETRYLKAEERAMRIPVLMSVPVVTCMLPVIVGSLMLPAIIDVVRTLVPALAGHPGG